MNDSAGTVSTAAPAPEGAFRDGRAPRAYRWYSHATPVMTIERLFAAVYPGLVRFLQRRVGDRDTAEDLAQEAFVRLLAHAPENPEGWLFVVAANLARDAARRDLRGARRMVLLKASHEAHLTHTADQELVAAEERATVHAALARLSERDASLLLLHQEGLSYAALAEVVGVAPSSIAPLLARARKRLLRVLAGPGEEQRVDDRASA